MKPYDEIMLQFVEPLVKNFGKLEDLLKREIDIEDNQAKQALMRLIQGWREEFEEFRDGNNESYDPNLIEEHTEADHDGSLGSDTGTAEINKDAPLDDYGHKVDDFFGNEDGELEYLDPDSLDDEDYDTPTDEEDD